MAMMEGSAKMILKRFITSSNNSSTTASSPFLGINSGRNEDPRAVSFLKGQEQDLICKPLDFSSSSSSNNKKKRKEVEQEEQEEEDQLIDIEEDHHHQGMKMKSPSEIDVCLNLSSKCRQGEEQVTMMMSPSPTESWRSSPSSSPMSPTMSVDNNSNSGGHTHHHHHHNSNQRTTSPQSPWSSVLQMQLPPNAHHPHPLHPYGIGGIGGMLSPGGHMDPSSLAMAYSQLLPPLGSTGANTNANGISPSGGGVGMSPGGGKVRATRPFKAYPKDPMSFSAVGMYGLSPTGTGGSSTTPTIPATVEALLQQQSHQAYAEFRKQMLASAQLSRGRRASAKQHHQDEGNSPSFMDPKKEEEEFLQNKNKSQHLGKTEQQIKDEAYWERRRKNNEAAKRSRDARRAKEDEIAIRAAFLEQENLKLRFELCALKNETAKLRCMLYST